MIDLKGIYEMNKPLVIAIILAILFVAFIVMYKLLARKKLENALLQTIENRPLENGEMKENGGQ